MTLDFGAGLFLCEYPSFWSNIIDFKQNAHVQICYPRISSKSCRNGTFKANICESKMDLDMLKIGTILFEFENIIVTQSSNRKKKEEERQ